MNYIHGKWHAGSGESFHSTSPVDETVIWTGHAADTQDVRAAVDAAREALPEWSARLLNERIDLLNQLTEQLRQRLEELAQAICLETGKPLWDARTEVEAMIAKIPLSIEACRERCHPTALDLAGVRGTTCYRPLGVIAVFGPFNFPGHIANGHIVPALLAGNTVVFKPSELTPHVAELTIKLWEAAGLPPGVLNLVQGGRSTGSALVDNRGLDGILFTGSVPTGMALQQALVGRPNVLLALELGGNNPLVVHQVSEIEAAVYWTLQSAFLTSGQRCTCARRLIVTPGNEKFLEELQLSVRRLRVGDPTGEPAPFMGPVIHSAAASRVLAVQDQLLAGGARAMVRVDRLSLGPAYLSPGIIDVTECSSRDDSEVFGPLLQLIRAPSLDAAILEANATQFGLVAALFSDSQDAFEQFSRQIRTGLINWNRPTTGASGRLPFGGLGLSGNHRPAGYFMIDSCVNPIASMEAERLTLPAQRSPGLSWGIGQT